MVKTKTNFMITINAGLLVGFLCFSINAFANNGSVPVNQQSQLDINKPQKGQSMQQIEAQFGPPVKEEDAVGEPPISRWQYAKFTVYFEYDKVIHAVAHRTQEPY